MKNFNLIFLLVVFCIHCLSAFAVAQQPPDVMSERLAQLVNLLGISDTKSNLNLSDLQSKQLREILKEMRGFIVSRRDALLLIERDGDTQVVDMNEVIREERIKALNRIVALMDETQRKRLPQILAQELMRNRAQGSYALLFRDEIPSALNLNDDQKEQLGKIWERRQEALVKVTELYVKEVSTIVDKEKQDLFSMLSPSQRERAHEIIGERISKYVKGSEAELALRHVMAMKRKQKREEKD